MKGAEETAPDIRGTPSSIFENCCKVFVSAGIAFLMALVCFERVRATGPTLLGRAIVLFSSSSVSTTKEGTGAISSCSMPSIITKEGVGIEKEG